MGVQVAADEAILQHAAFQLRDAVARRYAGRLRQHADADEIVREQRAHPVDQLVARCRPCLAGAGVTEVVPHTGGARREDGQVGAALLLQLQLAVDDAGADLIVGDGRTRWRRLALAVGFNLLGAPGLVLARRRGVMPMAVDDHCGLPDVSIRRRPDSVSRTADASQLCGDGRLTRGGAGLLLMVGVCRWEEMTWRSGWLSRSPRLRERARNSRRRIGRAVPRS